MMNTPRPDSRQDFSFYRSPDDTNLSSARSSLSGDRGYDTLFKVLTIEHIKIPTFGFPSYPTLRKYRKELVKKATPQEKILMNRLQGEGISYKFQKIIAPYIVDFWFKDLIVELDGSHHLENFRQINYDSHRDDFLRGFSSNIMRFPNTDIEDNLDFVVKVIRDNLAIKKHQVFHIARYNSNYHFDRSNFLCQTSYYRRLKKFHRLFKKHLRRALRYVFHSTRGK